MKRLRLVKVVCQPVFVVDDGESLAEQVAQPIEVGAADWPGIVARLEADRAQHEVALNDGASREEE
jgi:hypothetical protein